MILNSYYKDLGAIKMPRWQNRQLCMQTFETDTCVLPEDFADYVPVVRQLCKAAAYSGEAHLTVDEKVVNSGWSQRRPRAHVDGYYVKKNEKERGDWKHDGGWIHYRKKISFARMPIIVASDTVGCFAYEGQFRGEPMVDGDLEHIRDQFKAGEELPTDRAFFLSPDCVHESMVFGSSTRRVFLRIALGKALVG